MANLKAKDFKVKNMTVVETYKELMPNVRLTDYTRFLGLR